MVANEIECSNDAFGGDPHPYNPKKCFCLEASANLGAPPGMFTVGYNVGVFTKVGHGYCRGSWCSICGHLYSAVKFCLSSASLCEAKCLDRGPACKGIAFTHTPEGDNEQCGILKLGR